ncbi:MAG: CRISPR-associated protein Cas4 [Firmicutes bacterium]|nr:CRISPR-associated protein Cas4 [Bacillota bacterium]
MNPTFYDDENLLPLSGIQHFAFCERQWALIHVENQWAENVRTIEGKQLHERVDDPYFVESRGAIKTIRSVPLLSRRLGLYGFADVIEYYSPSEADHLDEMTIIEYKRGRPKPDDRDEVQLCAQAMCLEEMLGIRLKGGFFFYGETRHRHKILYSKDLRERVIRLSEKMHDLFAKGITPHAVKSKKCSNCSMKDLCLPILGKKKSTVGKYIKRIILEALKETPGD